MDLNLNELTLEGKVNSAKKVDGGILVSFDSDKKIFFSDEEMLKMIQAYG